MLGVQHKSLFTGVSVPVPVFTGLAGNYGEGGGNGNNRGLRR